MNMHEGVSAVPPLSSVQGWYYQSQIHEAKGQKHGKCYPKMYLTT